MLPNEIKSLLLILIFLFSQQTLAFDRVSWTANDPVPSGQLPDNVLPLEYELELKLNPEQPTFSGQVNIQIRLKQPLQQFYINGENLTFKKVLLIAEGGKKYQASASKTSVKGVMKIKAQQLLVAGKYTLSIAYSADFNENLQGLYRIKDGSQYYAFTQFESIYARFAFPAFDEPRFKTPYKLSVVIPEKLKAVANTPEKSIQPLDNGWKRVVFLASKPLPTYLVAIAVGDFDIVTWKDMPATHVRHRSLPLRGIATKGKGKKLKYALSETQSIVEALEDYFQIAYPYRKLDILAVPDFAAGAMENAGAITYREQLLLLDDRSSLAQKRSSKSVQAHELAHQWFGNLVTPVWWNDIWLNEAFATWMAATALDRKWPGQQWRRQQIRASKNAMNSDSIPSARKIRNPIKSNSDIITAFDGITYQKGSGVLSMIESFMGKENFRHGVQKYMHKYAWKNTTALDFFNTLASVLKPEKARQVVTSFRNFVEQAGVPLLGISKKCVDGITQLHITQQRYAPLGTQFKQKTLWDIPVCMKYEMDQKIYQQCEVLSQADQFIKLKKSGCASWIMPNVQATGYYRFNFDTEGWKEILSHLDEVGPKEANAVLDSMKAAFNSAHLSVEDLIQIIPATLESNSWEVQISGLGTLKTLINFADEKDKPALRKLAANLYRKVADAIGLNDNTAADMEKPYDTSQLRTRLISFMALTAKDLSWRKKLLDRAKKYIGFQTDGKFHNNVIIPALRTTAMSVAVQELGTPYVEALLKLYTHSNDGTLRGRIIRALTATEDLNTAKKLINYSLSPKVRDNEKVSFLFGLISKRELDPVMWPWLKSHFDQLIAGLPTNFQAFLPYLFVGECNQQKLRRMDNFLKPRLNKLLGADRNFAKAKESLTQCLARKAYIRPQIKTLLKRIKKQETPRL